MELLFSNTHEHALTLPKFYIPSATVSASSPPPQKPTSVEEGAEGAKPVDVRFLVWWLREYLLEDRERPELFSQGENVCVPFPRAL